MLSSTLRRIRSSVTVMAADEDHVSPTRCIPGIDSDAPAVMPGQMPSALSRVFVFALGMLGVSAGVLAGNVSGVIAAGLFMFVAGSFGAVGADRKAVWLALRFGGLGIAGLGIPFAVAELFG